VGVKIGDVERNSLAFKAGLKAGDEILYINGHVINDVLDYRFYTADERLEIELVSQDGRPFEVKMRKDEYEDLGLDFETYLMDKQRSCKNKCIFCFIDQLPEGMRESLYFKDDDSRLSFLFGNYITLTNLSDGDVDRIIDMHISPVNVSVHTTDPELRVKMMANKNAGKSLAALRRFADAGIGLNCQLVLCPGINDGEKLIESMNDLEKLMPSLISCAAVPVGLTKYRKGLYPLMPYDAESASRVLDAVEKFGDYCVEKYGRRVFYAADEFYLKAGRKIPDSKFYEDFPQIENGVGIWASLRDEFVDGLSELPESDTVRSISLATGESAAKLMSFLVDELTKKWHNLQCDIYPIRNDFFGPMINVAGLITGRDLIAQLKGCRLGSELMIPRAMLRQGEDVFLDDVTLEDAQKELNIKIVPVGNDGFDLLDALIGEEN